MRSRIPSFGVILVIGLTIACNADSLFSPGPDDASSAPIAVEPVDRESKIPPQAVKMSPATDIHPPVLLSDEFEPPLPVPGKINTAGAEDSPFIAPDGKTFYFFFTPDASIPAEQQLFDGVTGIYVSHNVNGEWDAPQRIFLQDPGKLGLDGCEFVLGDTMWFCTIREGYEGIHWFTAEFREGSWRNWKIADFDPGFEVGEMHIAGDGKELFFGSGRPGGSGGMDLWASAKVGGEWQDPVNLSLLNTKDDEGWPATHPDGSELWFYRNYGIWRSKKVNGEWQAAEQIVSTLAGEPTLDNDGNLYFVHHYYIDDKMIEADIYVAYRK
jgi:hypothetical protein